MSAPATVNHSIVSIPEAAEPTAIHEWAKQVGPLLLRLIKQRNLTPKEGRLMRAIKEICPCHWTDHPKEEFFPNGETCEICGRPI
ncbi:MAG: hypothetical protein ACYC1K_02325 [Minisyncoccota bacterium]